MRIIATVIAGNAATRTFTQILILLCALVVFLSAPVPGFGVLVLISVFVFLVVFDSQALPLFGLSPVPLGPSTRRLPSRGPPAA
jgi:hypothetical protein